MMGVLKATHPDIEKFITSKLKSGVLSKFNISVAINDHFMKKRKEDREYWLVNPRNKERVEKRRAREVWDMIAKSAWESGDPGVIFIGEINRHNPLPEERIEATNPCGEQPLLPYESCNLGSINLSKMEEDDGEVNWKKLRETVRNAVHFLDNVIDANQFPMKEIKKTTEANRKIGLGVMGFADLLIKLRIPYNSKKALKLLKN